MNVEDPLDTLFGALANPTRRAILARLLEGEATVTELLEPFEMSQPAISRHIRVLEESGLISRGRDAQFRPCRLDVEPLVHLADWLEPYRKAWEGRFVGLGRLLDKLQSLEVKLRRNDQ